MSAYAGGPAASVETCEKGLALRPAKTREVFHAMLTVDIPTDEAPLNHLAEVMGDVFAGYSHGSAFFEDARIDKERTR